MLVASGSRWGEEGGRKTLAMCTVQSRREDKGPDGKRKRDILIQDHKCPEINDVYVSSSQLKSKKGSRIVTRLSFHH